MDKLLSLRGEQVLSTYGWAWTEPREGEEGREGRQSSARLSAEEEPEDHSSCPARSHDRRRGAGPGTGTPRSQCTPGGMALGHQPGCQVRGCAQTPVVSAGKGHH